jgi:PAS domain S-box-containing protein
VLRIALIFAALPFSYVIFGWLGLLLAVPPGYATAVFLPAGIAVGATLLVGSIALAPIFVSSFLLNLIIGYSITGIVGVGAAGAALIIAAASTLQAMIAAVILRKLLGDPPPLDTPQNIVLFLILVPALCLTSGTAAVAGLFAIGSMQQEQLLRSWINWCAGDALGVLVTLPILLTIFGQPLALWRYRRIFVAVPMLLSFALFVLIFIKYPSWGVLAAGGLGTGLLGAFLLLGTAHTYHLEKIAEKLRRSELELHTIISTTPFMLTRCGSDMRYRFVSPAYAEMLGRCPEDIVGRPIADVIGADGFTAILPYIAEVLAGRRTEYESEVEFKGVGKRFLKAAYVPESNDDGKVTGWIASILDISERKRAEAIEKTLVGEIEHRSNNLLAVVQNIAYRSISGSQSLEEARTNFETRLQALKRLNDRLTKAKIGEPIPLSEVLRAELEPFAARMTVDGDGAVIPPSLIRNFSLMLHELATNAAKHGCLSNSSGRLEIFWRVNEVGEKRILNFRWNERDGPAVAPPRRVGFGTSLLKAAFPGANLVYADTGFFCEISADL